MRGRSGEVHHPLFARVYHRQRVREDAWGVTEHRRELLSGLTGRVVEIGAGDGANFAHYPATVAEVVAVEPEAYLRAVATEAARHATVPVTVLAGTAEALPVNSASADAAVASLVLCSVRDPAGAAAEMARVLRPEGELRFYEHVRAETAGLALLQRVGAPVQALLGGGCHPDRDTVSTLQSAGFRIERLRRFEFRPFPPALLSTPHVIGSARPPVR